MKRHISPKVLLVPQINNYQANLNNKSKEQILTEANYTCAYCSSIFTKYMYCVNSTTEPKNTDSIVCCKACYMITHLNININNAHEIKLYWSQMDQYKIVQNTIDFVIENNRCPYPTEIDPTVMKLQLSLYEFVNILGKTNNNLPNNLQFLKNCKIFFSKNLDTTFITANCGPIFMFIDEKPLTEDSIIIKSYIFNNVQNNNLTKIYSCNG